ncbi:MAG: TonB-dependent receptor [Pseudomonadales bacterium]|nr:TonB-dependent receptor [Pseudomonadales bacterium]
MKDRSIAGAGVLCMVLGAPVALAQPGVDAAASPDRDESRLLEEVVVKGQLINSRNQAFSAERFDAERIRELELVRLTGVLESVSGMSVRQFGLPGVADSITIRGFGGGGHGGDLGVVLDGVPLNEAMSHADGYVDMNVVVPLEIAELTVFKGPVSALYGNYNRGGLLKVDTRSGGEYREIDVSGGSDGLLDVQAAFAARPGPAHQTNLALQHQRSDGYRPRSDSEHSTFAGRWRTALGTDWELALSGRWHEADSNNAGYVTETQYRSDPYGIDPNMQNDGAEKSFATARFDLNYRATDELKLLGFIYGTTQDFSRWFTRPTGAEWRQREETYDRKVVGAGLSFNGRHDAAGTPLKWVTGVETFRESTRYQYYDGLDNRIRTAPAINDRDSELDSVSAFTELQADWHRLLMPSIGLRYDRFNGRCRPTGPETSTAPCADLNDIDALSPKLGIRSAWHDTLETRVSYAEGFSLPNGWIKYQPEATNLDPVTFRQYELGMTWNPTPRLEIDLAAYRLDSDGEVRTVAPGVFENYGVTERSGVEGQLTWAPLDTLTFTAVFGTADAEIVRNDSPALVGNDVGGVAEYSATMRADWRFLPTWQLNVSWRGVGDFALNDINSAYAEGYELLDLGLVFSRSALWRLYARIENLTDETYSPSQFIIGGTSLYAPGAPRQFRLGLQMDL